jgi:hypothetical protein
VAVAGLGVLGGQACGPPAPAPVPLLYVYAAPMAAVRIIIAAAAAFRTDSEPPLGVLSGCSEPAGCCRAAGLAVAAAAWLSRGTS